MKVLHTLLLVLAVVLCCAEGDNNDLPSTFVPEWELSKCPVQTDVSLIVYNSIPKSGSTTLRHHITSRSDRGRRFKFLQMKQFRHRRMVPEEVCDVVDFIARNTLAGGKAIFDEHMYYANFSKCQPRFSANNIAYINLFREPVSRAISRYYYELQIGQKKKQSPCLSRGSIEDCLQKNSLLNSPWKGAIEPDLTDGFCLRYHLRPVKMEFVRERKRLCERYYKDVLSMLDTNTKNDRIENREEYILRDEMHNYETKHLCGQSSLCHERSNASLQQAISNVRNVYALVGLTEYLDLSWMLLWRLFPEFFGTVEKTELDVGATFRVTHTDTKAVKKHSEYTVEWIESRNRLDMALYAAVKDVFRERVRSCFDPCETLGALSHPSELLTFYTQKELQWFLQHRLRDSVEKENGCALHLVEMVQSGGRKHYGAVPGELAGVGRK